MSCRETKTASKYSYCQPHHQKVIDLRWLSQDLFQPHRRSLLNKYLHDQQDYQAVSVLRLWYATHNYTQVASDNLKVGRANIIWEKFFKHNHEQSKLPWNLKDDMPYIRKLYSSDVSVREKDAIIGRIKRQAYAFIKSRILATSYDSKRLIGQRNENGSKYAAGDGSSLSNNYDIFDVGGALDQNCDLSLRLSDLSFSLSQDSDRNSNITLVDSARSSSFSRSSSRSSCSSRSARSHELDSNYSHSTVEEDDDDEDGAYLWTSERECCNR
jgi:hypothetical protein